MDSLQDLATPNKIEHEILLSSLPPTPKHSTAFTIEFDDMNNNSDQLKANQKSKRFDRENSLRDSLRKYAPEKLEKLTKVRAKDDSGIGTQPAESDRGSNLSDGASFLIQKMFNGGKCKSAAVSKAASKACSQQQNKNRTTNSKDFKSSSSKSTPVKLRNFNTNSFNSFNNSHNSATSKTSSSSFRSPTTLEREMDSGVCVEDQSSSSYLKDEDVISETLSETGTYTVELDNQDPIAEEARKRINEIFGVKEEKYQPVGKQRLDSMSSSGDSSANSKHSFKISSVKKSSALKNPQNDLQPKTENGSTEHLAFRRSSLQSASLRRQNSFSKSSAGKLSVCKSAVSSNSKPNSSNSTKKSQLNQNISLINQNNTFVFNCATNPPGHGGGPNSLLNRARANSITRSHLTKQRRIKKEPLNGGTYDDSTSVKSEDASTGGSTDLSSINSDKCKSDTGQATSLRFNRAFALRRARLGIDTPPSTPKNSSKPNSQLVGHSAIPQFTNQSRSSSQGSAPTEFFDRSDGGRFSLRASKPPIASRQTGKLAANKSKLANPEPSVNHLVKHDSSSSLISAISASKSKVVGKLMNQADYLKNAHVRANSFGGNDRNSPLSVMSETAHGALVHPGSHQLAKPRLSSALSNSSNNTMSNASTSEDLSNVSDQINVKNLQNLSPFQLGRRIYSTKPHYMAQTNSFRNRLEENGAGSNPAYSNGNNVELLSHEHSSLPPHPFSSQTQSNELAPFPLSTEKKKFGQLSVAGNSFNFNSSGGSNSNKSLSALDYLVLSAVNELSFKLRCKLRQILDAEKSKYPVNNENRILIEELLPQVNLAEYRNSENSSEKTISRDLSNVLKNLKRVEQSLEGMRLIYHAKPPQVVCLTKFCFSLSSFPTNSDQPAARIEQFAEQIKGRLNE